MLIFDSKFIYSSMNALNVFIILFTLSGEYCAENNSFASLKTIDENLTNFYKFPERYSNFGKYLLSNLEKVNNTIKHFMDVIEKKSKTISVLKEAKELRIQGGPLFLKVKMNQTKIDTIRASCNWEIKDVEYMFLRRLEVKNTWRRFYKLYRKNKAWLEKCFIEAGVHVNANITFHLRFQQKKQNFTAVNITSCRNISNSKDNNGSSSDSS